MRKNRGIIVGMSSGYIRNFIENFSFKVFAEETQEGDDNKTNQNTPSPTFNYEDLIAKARKEEKDKQYATIERYKTQVNSLTSQHNEDLLRIASLEEELKTANSKLTTAGKGDSEEIKNLKEQIKTLTSDKESLDKKVKEFESQKPVSREEVETQVRAELEAEYEVKAYKVTKMAELKDEILVPELIFGNTKEEIDASIKSALERSTEIRKSLGVDNKQAKKTPKTPSNPSVNTVQDKEYSLEYLANLDVRSPEYAEVRKNLGLK